MGFGANPFLVLKTSLVDKRLVPLFKVEVVGFQSSSSAAIMLSFIKGMIRFTFFLPGASFTDCWDSLIAREVSPACEQVSKVLILVSLDSLACKGADVLVLIGKIKLDGSVSWRVTALSVMDLVELAIGLFCWRVRFHLTSGKSCVALGGTS